MDLKSKFYIIFKALNPYNYSELVEHKFYNVIKYYLFIIFFSVLVMSILFIPFLFYTGDYVSKNVEHFENLTVKSEFALKDSFNLLSDPVIRFEPAEKNMTNELVLITPQAVSYKRYFVFGSQRNVPLQGADIANSARAKMLISLGFFFLLPSLFFWAIIFSIVYFTAILLITYILVLIFAGLFRINIEILRLFKMCMYALTIFILLQLLLMPFFRIFILPLAAYWILIIIILFLWRDHQKSEHHPQGDEENFKGSKSREIFGGGKESAFKQKHNKSALSDSYDVDEHGNIKGSSKKHKSMDEDDNDGYVEL
jgi:hypothetical protein